MTYVATFLIWTFGLYWIHRIAHVVPGLSVVHGKHHTFITENKPTEWHWNNIFLFNDTWWCTLDLWLSEVIPTIILSYLTGQWWLILGYYIWAAFFQENLEHNTSIDYPMFTCGKWHMIHHRSNYNYGFIFPIWDKLFKTEQKVN